MGNVQVTKQNLKIVDIDLNNNLIAIKGSVPGKKNTNIIPPAQMTITARAAPKICAHIRAALPEIFFLDLISLVISG